MDDPKGRAPHRKYKRLHRIEGLRHARGLNFACFHDLPFLRSDRACRWFADALVMGLEKHAVHLWAYCFMHTHAHLVVFPTIDESCMSDFLATVKQSVSKKAVAWVERHAPEFLVRMQDRQPNGKVFHRFWERGGGYDRNLWSPRAIWNMINYVHRNPVEAGLCKFPWEWHWSSAAWYRSRAPIPIPVNVSHIPW